MKVKASDNDTAEYKKISIIDQLGASMSYNMAAKERPWSDLNTNIRLKWWKSYTFSLNARFATYAYHLKRTAEGKESIYLSDKTEYHYGRFGRFQGMSQNISYTLNPEKIKKLFGGGDDKKKKDSEDDDDDDFGDEDGFMENDDYYVAGEGDDEGNDAGNEHGEDDADENDAGGGEGAVQGIG